MAELTLPPEAQALLDAISGPESRGRYNVRFGGKTFSDYTDHPRTGREITRGPNKGKVSTAAGRYQITQTTWDTVIQPALNLPDFSPESQDIAAWYLAQKDYKRKRGSDLLADLRSGDPDTLAQIGKSLSGTWTSLPGGIEQGTSVSRFRNAYTAALQTRSPPVSPEVPPPPNRTPAGTAVAALDRLLGNSDPTGTAYAPDMGSLTASPVAPKAPPVPVQRQALPVRARSAALPSGAPVQALPGIPPRIAPPTGTAAALPPPMPRNAVTPPAPLNAPEPLVPTIRAKSPWAPWEEMALARTAGQPTAAPKPPRVPPSSTFDLAMQIQPYARNYVPTEQRVAQNQSTSPTPRKVQTVAIDPTTGGIAKPDLQGALDRIAAEKARLAGVTSPNLPSTLGPKPTTAGMTSPERMGNTTDTFQPSIRDRIDAQQKAALTKLPVDPRLAMAPGSMPAAAPKVAQNPETVISPGGVPIYKPSLDKTAMPYTGPSLAELAGQPKPAPSPWAKYPFNYSPPQGDPRLTAEPKMPPGTMPPVSSDPGLVTYEVDPKTGKPRMVMAPGVVPQVAGMPPIPRPRPGNAPIPPAPQRVAQAPIPVNRFAQPGYGTVNPGAGQFADPRTQGLFGGVFGRDSQRLGAMNRGERPLLSALARIFAGNQQQRPQVATASAYVPVPQNNTISDAERALREWASHSGSGSSLSS